MANALHYIKDQLTFLTRIKKHLRLNGLFLLIEYDMQTPNTWVPYPIGFSSAKDLFKRAGFGEVYKISERQSSFNRARIYSVLFRRASISQ